MSLSRQQFREWKSGFHPGQDIRVPQGRFVGLSGLSEGLGLRYDTKEPLNTSEEVGEAAEYASMWSQVHDYPISQLRAQHHIRRKDARTVFESIKNRGYDPDEPIRAVQWGDNEAVIINGHHRTLAARAAGMRTIPTELIDPEHMDRYLSGEVPRFGR